MYKNTLNFIFLIALFSCSSSKDGFEYPTSKKIDFVENLHGVEISDNYRWLEDFTSYESIDWIQRQNEFTQKFIKKNKYKKSIYNYLNKIQLPIKLKKKLFSISMMAHFNKVS